MINSNKSLYTEYDHHDPDFDPEEWIEEQAYLYDMYKDSDF